MDQAMDAKPAASGKDPGVKTFTVIDFIVILLLLSVAAYCINLFRLDLLQSLDARKDDPAGTIIIKNNIVKRRLSDRVIWDRLYTHSAVYPGDLIHVAEYSAAILEIGDSRIDLNENTLIRILPAKDGEGHRIELSEGALELAAGDGITLDVAGRQVRASSGTVLNISTGKNGTAVEVSGGSARFSGDGLEREIVSGGILALDLDGAELSAEDAAQLLPARRYPGVTGAPVLISPIQDSLFRYHNDPPNLNFQWSEMEDASFYILEVAPAGANGDNPDFADPLFKKQLTASSIVYPDIKPGTWYWRVSSVFPSAGENVSMLSSTASFRVEQTDDPLAQALVLPELPVVPIAEAVAEKAAELPPAPPRPPPPPPFPAPGNRLPAEGYHMGVSELRAQQGIAFGWSQVAGANAYIFTLFQRTSGGRRQIIQRTISPSAQDNIIRWTLTDLSVLDRGTFIWQVEAVSRNRSGTIERRGRIGENTFIIDVPPTAQIEVEDTGVLYGN